MCIDVYFIKFFVVMFKFNIGFKGLLIVVIFEFLASIVSFFKVLYFVLSVYEKINIIL